MKLHLLFFYLLTNLSLKLFAQNQTVLVSTNTSDVKIINADIFTPFNGGAAIIKKGDSETLIDSFGKLIFPFNTYILGYPSNSFNVYSYVYMKNCGKTDAVVTHYNGGIFVAQKKVNNQVDKMQEYIISSSGKILHSFDNRYSDIVSSSNGSIFIANNSKTAKFRTTISYTCVFNSGVKFTIKDLVPLHSWSNNLHVVYNEKTKKSGYINQIGNLVIGLKYDKARPFSEGLAAVAIYNEFKELKWGYINLKGEQVIDFIYSNEPCAFSSNLAMVTSKTISDFKYAFIDRHGNIKFKIPLNSIDLRNGDDANPSVFFSGFIIGYSDVLDSSGRIYKKKELNRILNLPDSIEILSTTSIYPTFSSQVYLTNKMQNLTGLYDFNKKTYIPPIFCTLSFFDPITDLAYATIDLGYDDTNQRQKFKSGYINRKGQFVILLDNSEKW